MEALEHAERAGRSGGFARRPRDDARHARVDVAREGRGVRGIGQRDVDVRDVFGAGRHAGRPRQVEQIGQVQAHFARHGAEPRRIGRRLVDARDAELARAGAGGVRRQLDDAADDEPLLGGELAGDQDVAAVRPARPRADGRQHDDENDAPTA